MNKFDAYMLFFGFFALILFLLYLVFDYFATNPNAFWDKWTKKTLWLWLPIYGLQRLIKEVILKKK
ncbi:MAG TPA: hypothetical protein DCS28_03060 [Candidatus Moranbacteria bacterium]|nr:hypothetical protein [Candidatus Moranbacteria bacterium]HAT74992.1 hypothetical protein [Candidatus Moranbacteria bacterium]